MRVNGRNILKIYHIVKEFNTIHCYVCLSIKLTFFRPINIGSSAVHDAYILENQGWEMTHGPLRKPEQEDISAVPVNTEPSTTTIMNTGAISSPYSKPTLNIPESGAAAESFTLNQNQSNSANLVLSETPSLQPPSYEEAVNSPR